MAQEETTVGREFPELVEADFGEMFDTVFGGDNVAVHGMYKYEPETGDFTENTLIPAVYERFRKKQTNRSSLSSDSNKLYYEHGKDNYFPMFQLELQTLSATLKAAIEQTAKSAKGQGLTIECDDPQVREDVRKWLYSIGVNNNFERRLFLNLTTAKHAYVELQFGAKTIKVGQTSNGNTLKQLRVPNYISYRVGKVNKKGETEHFFHHPNFYKRYLQSKRLRAVKAYKGVEDALENALKTTVLQKDLETPFYEDESQKTFNLGRFIYQILDPSLVAEHYGVPSYITEDTINAIFMEAAISQMDIASVENGLTVAHFVTIPLIKPRDEDKEKMEAYNKKKSKYLEYIQDKLQGTENSDNIVVLFADPRRNHQPIEVAAVPHNNTAEVLEGKADRAERTILTAFRITNQALIGKPPKSGKGLNNQSGLLAEADDQFYTDYVYDFVELGEAFFNEELIPIWRKVSGNDTIPVKIVFPRKRRFNTMPSDKLLLAIAPTRIIWNLYNLGVFDEDARAELNRDLAERQIAKAPAVDTSNPTTTEEDPEED